MTFGVRAERRGLMIFAVFAFAALATINTARAGTIAVTAISRTVGVSDIAEGLFAGPNSGFGGPSTDLSILHFVDAVQHRLGVVIEQPRLATADQDTTYAVAGASASFHGSGSASIEANANVVDGMVARTMFDVSFELTEVAAFTLSGLLSGDVVGGDGLASAILFGPGGFFDFADGDTKTLSRSGVLDAGAYELLVSAGVDNGIATDPAQVVGGSARFDFDFSLSEAVAEVPEPASSAILCLGLAGATIMRRRGAC